MFISRSRLPHTRQLSRPFTLIELLVVVAIIAILASMLLGALTKARAKVRESNVVNAFKQLGMIAHGYGDDYDDFCVPDRVYSTEYLVPDYPATLYANWRRVMFEYQWGALGTAGPAQVAMGDKKYTSLMWDDRANQFSGFNSGPTVHPVGRGSYSMNNYFHNNSGTTAVWRKRSQCVGELEPFLVAAQAAAAGTTSLGAQPYFDCVDYFNPGGNTALVIYPYSSISTMALYFDGHAELKTYSSMMALATVCNYFNNDKFQ